MDVESVRRCSEILSIVLLRKFQQRTIAVHLLNDLVYFVDKGSRVLAMLFVYVYGQVFKETRLAQLLERQALSDPRHPPGPGLA